MAGGDLLVILVSGPEDVTTANAGADGGAEQREFTNAGIPPTFLLKDDRIWRRMISQSSKTCRCVDRGLVLQMVNSM